MELGTIQNEALELGTIHFFGNRIRHISLGFRKFFKAPFWKVPIGWYLGAGDAKRGYIFGKLT